MDNKHWEPPKFALISGRPVRHITDPDTGHGLWQKYEFATGEFVEDTWFVQSIIMFGVDPTDDEFNFSADIHLVPKGEFDEAVRDLEYRRIEYQNRPKKK